MLEISKEEFESFAKQEFTDKAIKYADNFCFIQAGSYFGELLHYELYEHEVHLHIEVDDWRLLRDYLRQKIITSEVCSSDWGRDWTLKSLTIQNSEDVKAAFRRIRDILEPYILRLEKEISLFRINLNQDISSEIIDEHRKLLTFFQETSDRIKQEQRKQPYHINVIDELHINENAHCRILMKLLQFVSSDGGYDIYKSLLDYIQENKHNQSFNGISIQKPHFTQEEQRIDLWVRDKDYAIIFENKACYANDQPEQLSNYIKKTLNTNYRKYKERDIYVVYLSPNGEEPEDQSWGAYKEDFKDRYINLSFRDDILPWLKEYVSPNIRQKDVFLQNAVAQYIDHLEGVFYLRTIQKQLNMNLNQFFYKHFKFEQQEGDYQSQVQFLQEQLDDMQGVLNKLNEFQASICEQIFEQWKNETKKLYPEFNPCKMIEDQPLTDVTIEIESNMPINVFIGGGIHNQLFCQVQFDKKSQQVKGTIIDAFRDLLPLSNDHCIWKYFPQHSYSDVFSCFCDVVNKFKDLKQSKGISSKIS